MKIVFIAPSTSQPRILKRIISLKDAGFEVKVYAYDRGVYNCNNFPQNIDLELLGAFEDGGNYVSKIKVMNKDISRIIRLEGRYNVIYYSFGYFGSLCLMLHKVKYVYEMSDVLYGYKRFNLIRPIMKFIDKRMVRHSEITLMTSEGFIHYLFPNSTLKNIVLQPNKLNQYFADKERNFRKISVTNNLKFAFVGAIRYPNTILRFAKIIGDYYPNHEFHFYGDSIMVKDFQIATSQYENVVFHGAFRNPYDLESIYHNIDIVVCCYENESLNERIAEPNKLYEAAFFGKPIIVSKNTFLATQVGKYRCGWAIDAYSDDSIRNFIDKLSADEYNHIVDVEMSFPVDFLIDNPQKLIDRLKSIN